MELEVLVDAYREGRPGAARELARELYRLISPVFRGRFDDFDAEDLTQETIRVVLRDLYKFENRGRGSFKAWVRQTARNRGLAHAHKLARGRRLGSEGEADARASATPGPDDVIHWRERLAVVAEVFDLVDPKFRAALEFLVTGGDPAELAEQLELKPQTVRSRASRALMAIRVLVRERWQSSASFFSTPG